MQTSNCVGLTATSELEKGNMSTDIRIIPGIVRNGVVVPQLNSELPDAAHVNIVLQPAEMPQELKEELGAWQRAGNEAWQMIDKWENDEQ